jgi:FKBP12-rapamycin complex-associated protein
VPFRLTRQLIQVMEVSGVEGTYRATCERVMGTLRANRDSLMAMLEAFVHDPLIGWKAIEKKKDDDSEAAAGPAAAAAADGLNEEAMRVIRRISDKLHGRDQRDPAAGPLDEGRSTEAQVDRLIKDATDNENLCQHFSGWCAVW